MMMIMMMMMQTVITKTRLIAMLLFVLASSQLCLGQSSPPVLHVQEDAQPGHFIGEIYREAYKRLEMVSPDKAQTAYFKLEPANTNRLVVARALDRDADRKLCKDKGWPQTCSQSLNFLIDGQNMITVQVIVQDVNDHAPEWPLKNVTLQIPENAAKDERFPLPTASDPDLGQNSIVEYSLVGSDLSMEQFRLDMKRQTNSNGQQTVNPGLVVQAPLDYEREKSYSLELVARDGQGREGRVNLLVQIVDVNDNAPEFTDPAEGEKMEIYIDESLAEGSRLPRHPKAQDHDSGQFGRVEYSFAETTPDFVKRDFRLNKTSGELFVKNRLDVDEASGIAVYEFAIVAQDGAVPARRSLREAKLVVHVQDVNDNPPRIEFLKASQPIMENVPEEQNVAIVMVSDPDSGPGGRFTCQLAETSQQRANFRLEQLKQVETGDQQKMFYNLYTRRQFDREVSPSLKALIECHDEGSPRKSAREPLGVEIGDLNDNAPQFLGQSPYQISTSEGNVEGALIGQVKAEDLDAGENARLSYRIEWPEDQGTANPFGIDDEGNLVANTRLDREERPDGYRFTVWVADNGKSEQHSASTQVQVTLTDVNDCTPEFQQPRYAFHVEENSANGTQIGQVHATDRDLEGPNSRIRYEIKNANKSPFRIDPKNGTIFVQGYLDREQTAGISYLLTVVAHDSPMNKSENRSVEAQVDIFISDVNDNAPRFLQPPSGHVRQDEVDRFTVAVLRQGQQKRNNNQSSGSSLDNVILPNELRVSYREAVGFRLTQLQATDADGLPENKRVLYHHNETTARTADQNEAYFALDENTGELTVARAMTSTDQGVVLLTLTASDQGNPRQSSRNWLFVRIDNSAPLSGQSMTHKQAGYSTGWGSWLGGMHDISYDNMIIISVSLATFLICMILISVICLVSRGVVCRGSNSGRRANWRRQDAAMRQQQHNQQHHQSMLYAAAGKESLFEDLTTGLIFANAPTSGATLQQQQQTLHPPPSSTYYPFYSTSTGAMMMVDASENAYATHMPSRQSPYTEFVDRDSSHYQPIVHYRLASPNDLKISSFSPPNNANNSSFIGTLNKAGSGNNEGAFVDATSNSLMFKNRHVVVPQSPLLTAGHLSSLSLRPAAPGSPVYLQVAKRPTILQSFATPDNCAPSVGPVPEQEAIQSFEAETYPSPPEELLMNHVFSQQNATGDSDVDSGRGGSLGMNTTSLVPNNPFAPTSTTLIR